MGGAVRGDFQPSIWMNWAIISAGILKPPVGHLRGEQKKSESGNLKAETGKLNTGQGRLVVGDGAFAPEAWGRSASRPYPLFHLRGFALFAVSSKRQRTDFAPHPLLGGFASLRESSAPQTAAMSPPQEFSPRGKSVQAVGFALCQNP